MVKDSSGSKVVSLFSNRPVRPVRSDATTRVSQSIGGTGNVGVVGDGNHVHITVRSASSKRGSSAAAVPGPQEITNEQAASIKQYVNEVAMHTGQPHQRVYSALYKHIGATSYLMIRRDRYDEAVTYLRKWLARFSGRQVPSSSEEHRKLLLKRIHAEARRHRGRLDEIHAYISGRFGTSSLGDLMPGQLLEVVKEFRL